MKTPEIQQGTRFARRQCPVCHSDRSQLLYRQSFALLSKSSLMEGYDVVICEQCGAGFANDIPEQAVFDAYYRDLSKYEGPVGVNLPPPPVEPRFRDVAELIERFVPASDSRILEIGSAFGGLLKALRDRGFSSLLGLDPSPGCVRAALEFYDIPGVVGTIFTAPVDTGPYDFLILTGVMEHIRDLDGAIDQFRRLMPLQGRIYLEVPDASRYEARLDAPFQEFSIEHINFFSSKSLINLMQARGFRLIEAGHQIRPQHEVTCPCTYGVFEYVAESSAIVLILAWSTFSLAAQAKKRYEAMEPLNIAGMQRIHVPHDQGYAMRELVRLISAHQCTRLFTVPSILSLSLWSGTQPSTLSAGNWVNATSDEFQRELIESVSRDPQTCVVYSQKLVDDWMPLAVKDVSSKPVVRFIKEQNRPEFSAFVKPDLDYEFMVQVAPGRPR